MLLAGGFALVWYVNKPEEYEEMDDRPPFDNEHDPMAHPIAARLPRGAM